MWCTSKHTHTPLPMPSRSKPHLASFVAELKSGNTGLDDLILRAAEVAADLAVGKVSPARSIASTCRELRRRLDVSAEVEAQIRTRALSIHRRTVAEIKEGGRARGWWRVSDLAAHTQKDPKVIESNLLRWEFRKACGWPMWFLDEWLIPADAVSGPRAAVYHGSKPKWEPYDRDELPAGCTRQPGHPADAE